MARLWSLKNPLLAVILFCAAGFAGYQQLFSSFAPYDDEGYMMVSLVCFMDGKPLYDETFTQYGPAHYLIQGAVHRASGLPVTHDVTRLKTLAIWLLTALLAGAFICRITASWPLGLAGMLLSFLHLDRLSMEPGHPQELCAVLIVGALLATTFFAERRLNRWLSVLLGIMAGTVCATKPNVGVFLVAGLSAALCLPEPYGGYRRWFVRAVQLAVLLLPVVLMHEVLFSAGGIVLAGVVTFSAASVLLVARNSSAGSSSGQLTTAALFLGMCAVAVFLWCGAVLASGTSIRGLIDGLVLQHAGFGTLFFATSPVKWFALPWSAGALLLAIAATRGNVVAGRIGRTLLAAAACLVALQHLLQSFSPLEHGLTDRGAALFLVGIGTPLLWTLLLPDVVKPLKTGEAIFGRLPRIALCLVAALQPLGVFPTPGTQAAIGSVPLLLAGLLAAWDLRIRSTTLSLVRSPWRSLAGALAMLAVLATVCRDSYLWQRRQGFEPLGLHGAERLRLPPDEVARHRWLTAVLKNESDAFLFRYNGMNSYYLWTQTRPPTALNATCWPVLFDADQQRRILAAVQRCPRLCVVWQNHDWPATTDDAPLVRFLDEQFVPSGRFGDFEVRKRKDASLPSIGQGNG